MPGSSFTLPLRVRLYDLDLREQVSCATLFHYFEDAALRASSELGFTFAWYKERGQFWVIRIMRLERCCAAQYDEALQVRTWVSSMSRVRADRNYLVSREADGRVLARATANWVYLDGRTLFPARIAPEIVAMFKNTEPPALPPRPDHTARWQPFGNVSSVTNRSVQFYEADSALHVNNAVYVDWLEEAVRATLQCLGYELPLDGSPALWFYRHNLEYLLPARPGDQLEIATRLAGRGRSAARWRQEIRLLRSGEVLVRSDCTTVWVDRAQRPARWPLPRS